MILRKLIFLMGEKCTNALLRPSFKELKKTDFATLQELEDIQLVRLKKLLKHARDNSEFYRELLCNLNIDSMYLSDLSKLPIISKKSLIDNNSKISNNKYNEKLIRAETSGSTGDALTFYRSKQWDASTRAAQYRGYSWYNINPWEKNIYFWGFNPTFLKKIKMRFLDFLMNRYRIFSFNKEEIKKVSNILKDCSYIEGYSSAIYTLSQYLEEDKYKFDNIKLVKGTSEKIYESYLKTVKNVFSKKMVSEYGSAEAGIIAFECPQGNMHIAMENVIVEVINNKIIVTNLHSDTFPIIRYKLGDYISISDIDCPCGRKHKIIKEVTGRVGNKIYGNKLSYPTLILNYIFKNISLRYSVRIAYFGRQEEKGKLKIKILKSENEEETIKKYILTESKIYFTTDVDIHIEFIDNLKQNGKKIKDFESFIHKEK